MNRYNTVFGTRVINSGQVRHQELIGSLYRGVCPNLKSHGNQREQPPSLDIIHRSVPMLAICCPCVGLILCKKLGACLLSSMGNVKPQSLDNPLEDFDFLCQFSFARGYTVWEPWFDNRRAHTLYADRCLSFVQIDSWRSGMRHITTREFGFGEAWSLPSKV